MFLARPYTLHNVWATQFRTKHVDYALDAKREFHASIIKVKPLECRAKTYNGNIIAEQQQQQLWQLWQLWQKRDSTNANAIYDDLKQNYCNLRMQKMVLKEKIGISMEYNAKSISTFN